MKTWREILYDQIEACADEIKVSAPQIFTTANLVSRGTIFIKLDPNDKPTINYDLDVIPSATCDKTV